jgi:type II secretory pathway pseudopilin PulG
MTKQLFLSAALAAASIVSLGLSSAPAIQAQEGLDPAAALSAAIVAACRGNETQFSNYLTADNATAFRALPAEQRAAFLKRFSLSDMPGKPLSSTDQQNHALLLCQTPSGSVQYRFGVARVHENLAFIPVAVVDGEQAEFGLVRENGGWRLLSLGLVLLDIPQLAKQWIEEDLRAREDAATEALRSLADAIRTYNRAFGKLPESLAELGPAPKGQISPEQASLASADLAAGKQNGYLFRYRIVPDPSGNDTNFELAASPESYNNGGRRSFFLDAEGRIHSADKHGAVATSDDPLMEGEKTP